jgi:molecular chaperone GrpE (heat shock protein)
MALEDCLDALEEQREEEAQSQKRIAELESGQEKLLQVLDAYQEQVWNMMRYAAEHDPAWVAQIDLIRNAVRGKQISGGISLIEETGVRVDYALHEVIEIIDTAEEERAQVVAEIYHPGYVYMGVVKKKAKVAAYRYVQTDGQEQGTGLERGI